MPVLGRRLHPRAWRGLLVAAAAAPLLAACATGGVRKADTRLPAAYEAVQPADKAPEASLGRWWTLYNDPQLTELVEQALKNSPDARDAAAKLKQALAVRSSALSAYDPQGGIAASAQDSQYYLSKGATAAELENLSGLTGGVGGLGAGGVGAGGAGVGVGGASGAAPNIDSLLASQTYTLGFNASWELDLFGRRRAAKRSADADLRYARFTFAATRWSLAANVADSLFQARGLAIQLDQAQETLRIERQLYDASKARADHGLSPSSDTAQTQSNVQAAEAQAEGLGAQLAAARRSLLLLVGRGVDPLASLPMPAEVGAPPPVPTALPAELLMRRPDVRAAREQIDSATGRLSLDKRALLPTFVLQPGAGLYQDGPSAVDRLSFWTLAANATLPVLDRPRLLSVVRQQRAVAEQAVLAYEKSVQTAYGDAETAFTYYDSDKKRVALLVQAEKNASFAYEAKKTGYSRGLNDLQTALTAEASWRQARLSLASAQVSLMQRSVQVFKAIGGGWSADAAPVRTPVARAGFGAAG
jgi:NodT family efflux transporter outer membrane factor (OMF) lipoprotein